MRRVARIVERLLFDVGYWLFMAIFGVLGVLDGDWQLVGIIVAITLVLAGFKMTERRR